MPAEAAVNRQHSLCIILTAQWLLCRHAVLSRKNAAAIRLYIEGLLPADLVPSFVLQSACRLACARSFHVREHSGAKQSCGDGYHE